MATMTDDELMGLKSTETSVEWFYGGGVPTIGTEVSGDE